MIQGNLFEENEIQSAVKLLEKKGYIVLPPEEKIKADCRKLVEFFYNRLNFYRAKKNYRSLNLGMDLKLSKQFVQSLFDRGLCPPDRVYDKAHDVIEFMLKHENKLGLKTPITNMSVIGQDKMRWITDKTILLMNEELVESKEIGREDLDNKLEELQDELVNETINEDPEDLEKILRSIKNGKKENS